MTSIHVQYNRFSLSAYIENVEINVSRNYVLLDIRFNGQLFFPVTYSF